MRREITAAEGYPGALRQLLQCAVVGCFAAAISCSGEADVGKVQLPLTPGEGPVTLLTCSDLLLATHPIKPATEIDYIGLYQQFWPNRPDYIAVVSDHGEVCHDATDQCRARHQRLDCGGHDRSQNQGVRSQQLLAAS